jgi:pimeloyl-ACP methyl ester carboxylesterase
MFKRIVIISLVSSLILAFASCKKRSKKKKEDYTYLFNDPVKDPLDPPGILELKFNSSGSDIYGFEYLANGAGPHPTVILVHANPGNERNLDIAQALRRAGYNIVYFDYRGSWGSKGVYSYPNCIGDTRAVIDFVTDSANVVDGRIDTSKIYLLGHNLGAGIAMIEGLNDPRVKGVAVLSLVNPYTIFRGVEAKENFIDMKEYFSTLGMLNTTPQDFLMSMVNNLESYNIVKMVAGSSKPVMVIDEHHNNEELKRYLQKPNVKYEIWDTDLEFSDTRVTVTKKIKSWLDSCNASVPVKN